MGRLDEQVIVARADVNLPGLDGVLVENLAHGQGDLALQKRDERVVGIAMAVHDDGNGQGKRRRQLAQNRAQRGHAAEGASDDDHAIFR